MVYAENKDTVKKVDTKGKKWEWICSENVDMQLESWYAVKRRKRSEKVYTPCESGYTEKMSGYAVKR